MSKRKRKYYKTYKEVEISDIAIGGKAVAKIQTNPEEDKRLTIFVRHAVPGDIADIKVVKKKKNYLEAVPIQFHKFSDKRIEAFCEHFGTCGGCTRQSLSYQDQLFYKEKAVNEVLKRIGKADLPEAEPIVPSPDTKYYRNKLEYTFSHKRWLTKDDMHNKHDISEPEALGFHIPGRYDKVLDIKHCYLQVAPSDEIRTAVKNYAVKNKLDFYKLKEQTGLLRNLIIRTNLSGELMVILSVKKNDSEKFFPLLDYLSENFPQITSLQYVVNPKLNDTIFDLEVISYKGKPYITEQMGDFKFRIGPKSFYQTNSRQAHELYKLVKEFAELSGDENIYDLYTGTGTIALFLSDKAKKITGIEIVEEAVEDAKMNAEINHIKNVEFLAGDMRKILKPDFFETHGKPDIIIADPPRAGMHKDVIKNILNSGTEKIVYVSCNPATQARDLFELKQKYKVSRTRPADLFPHTHHVENILLLKKKRD